ESACDERKTRTRAAAAPPYCLPVRPSRAKPRARGWCRSPPACDCRAVPPSRWAAAAPFCPGRAPRSRAMSFLPNASAHRKSCRFQIAHGGQRVAAADAAHAAVLAAHPAERNVQFPVIGRVVDVDDAGGHLLDEMEG